MDNQILTQSQITDEINVSAVRAEKAILSQGSADANFRSAATVIISVVRSLADNFLAPTSGGQGGRFGAYLIQLEPLHQLNLALSSLAKTADDADRAKEVTLQVGDCTEHVIEILDGGISPNDDRAPLWRSELGHARKSVLEAMAELRSQRLTQLVGEATEVVSHVREAAGEAATHSLGEHYASFSAGQAKTADRLRILVALLLSAISVAAATFLLFNHGIKSWPEQLTRLSITVPLLLLAYYLSRESSRHRNSSARAREVEIRMRTVRAYTAELPRKDRGEILALLGRVAFGGPLTLEKEPENAVGDEAVQVLTVALQAVQSALGRSGK